MRFKPPWAFHADDSHCGVNPLMAEFLGCTMPEETKKGLEFCYLILNP